MLSTGRYSVTRSTRIHMNAYQSILRNVRNTLAARLGQETSFHTKHATRARYRKASSKLIVEYLHSYFKQKTKKQKNKNKTNKQTNKKTKQNNNKSYS